MPWGMLCINLGWDGRPDTDWREHYDPLHSYTLSTAQIWKPGADGYFVFSDKYGRSFDLPLFVEVDFVGGWDRRLWLLAVP